VDRPRVAPARIVAMRLRMCYGSNGGNLAPIRPSRPAGLTEIDPMPLPSFFDAMPALDAPFPDSIVSSHAIRSEAGLVVFFRFHQDFEVPPHSHGAQWGTVVEGEIALTIGGESRSYRPGDTYEIPAGVEHGARIKAGSLVIDVFAEPDRYPLKPR
jgi:quercetin dioxygenase-like cupin family protein